MTTTTDIGSLINCTPGVNGGRPCIAGTGVSVGRIAHMYKGGASPEEISDSFEHISLAQVYAALAYYHANHEALEAAFAAEDAEYERLERQHRERRASQGKT